MSEITRADLLSLTPDRYLVDGYLDTAGQLRPSLRGDDATAAATQLMAAEAAPQEVGFTLEAIRLLLPEHDEPTPRERLYATIREALETVARAIQQPNNKGILSWLSACAAAVTSNAEISAFVEHFQVVNRQYALLVALSPPDSSSLSS
jgi:hypothetical protein